MYMYMYRASLTFFHACPWLCPVDVLSIQPGMFCDCRLFQRLLFKGCWSANRLVFKLLPILVGVPEGHSDVVVFQDPPNFLTEALDIHVHVREDSSF